MWTEKVSISHTPISPFFTFGLNKYLILFFIYFYILGFYLVVVCEYPICIFLVILLFLCYKKYKPLVLNMLQSTRSRSEKIQYCTLF